MIFILKFAKPLLNILVVLILLVGYSYAPIIELRYDETETEAKEVIETSSHEAKVEVEQEVMQSEINTKQEIKEEVKTEVVRTEATSRGGMDRQRVSELSVGFTTPCVGKLSQGFSTKHPAVDIYNSYGTEIYASSTGICVQKVYSNVSYGNHIILEHSDGYETLYAHLSDIAIDIDQEVQQGELIGYMGSTGNSTGNHLHFEIYKDGKQVNPLKYITLKGND